MKALAAADLHQLVVVVALFAVDVVALFPAEDFVAASFAVAVVHVGALDNLRQPVAVAAVAAVGIAEVVVVVVQVGALDDLRQPVVVVVVVA